VTKDIIFLDRIAREVRYKLVEMSNRSQTGHLGGALSCVDVLVSAYWGALNIDAANPDDPDRDRLIFSKGHAISALYAVLAKRGYFPEKDLDLFNEEGGCLPEHPSPHCVPGIEWATGSLGHGLGVGIGMALAAKLLGKKYRVYVIMSDGECQEGSVWESAMFAPMHSLNNLTAIIDFNKWQATGRSCEIMAMEPLCEKFSAFGWRAIEVEGHDINAVNSALTQWKDDDPRPTAVIAHTVKGYGISFIQGDNNWHYRSPSDEEVAKAKAELKLS
jgi:transketolase